MNIIGIRYDSRVEMEKHVKMGKVSSSFNKELPNISFEKKI